MHKNEGFAAPLQTAVGLDVGLAGAGSARPFLGGSWRHLATLALLLVTLPVFLLAAAASLPVMLFLAGASGCRSAWRHWQARGQAPSSAWR